MKRVHLKWARNALLCTLFASSPWGFTQSLDVGQTVDLAIARSALSKSYEAGAQAAQEAAISAGQRPDPVLQLGINNLPIQGTDRWTIGRDFMTMRSIGVMQEWTRSEVLTLRQKNGMKSADIANKQAEFTRWQQGRDAATAWVNLYFSQEAVKAQQMLREDYQRIREAAMGSFRGGRSSLADTLEADADWLLSAEALRTAQEAAQLAQAQLSRWVGSENAKRPLASWQRATRTTPELLTDSTVQSFVQQHPMFAIERERIAQSQSMLDLAVESKKPNWSWTAMYNRRGAGFSDMISFGVNIPLVMSAPQRQDRDIAAARAISEQAQYAMEEAQTALELEIRQTQSMLNSAVERLLIVQDEVVPVMEKRVQAALAAYSGAQGSLTAVLQARKALTKMQTDVIRMRSEVARLQIQSDYFNGQLVPTRSGK